MSSNTSENFDTLLTIETKDSYSKQDIDSIINSMKELVKTVKTVHINSNMQIDKLKRLLSETRKQVNDSELFSHHLQQRVEMLESHKDEQEQLQTAEKMDSTDERSQEDSSPPSWRAVSFSQDIKKMYYHYDHTQPSPDDDIHDDDDDDDDGGDGGDDSQQPTQSQPNQMSQDTLPPPPPTQPSCSISDVENIVRYKDDFQKFKQQNIDERCRKTILYSNFPPGLIDQVKARKESFYPLLATKLKAYDLEFILIDVKRATIVGQSVKVEYSDAYRAGYMIRSMRSHIGLMKQNISDWGADHHSIKAAVNIRFTRLTAAKYNKKRKTLEKLAKFLKKSKKINFFDIFVVKNKIYLRTCWRKQEFAFNPRIFTYYDESLAQKILDGDVPIDERETRLQNSRHLISSGIRVFHAQQGDYIFGDIPEP